MVQMILIELLFEYKATFRFKKVLMFNYVQNMTNFIKYFKYLLQIVIKRPIINKKSVV